MPCRPLWKPLWTAACWRPCAICPAVFTAGLLRPGVAAVVSGEKTGKGIPKNIVTDGPVITKETAPGIAWMERHFLI